MRSELAHGRFAGSAPFATAGSLTAQKLVSVRWSGRDNATVSNGRTTMVPPRADGVVSGRPGQERGGGRTVRRRMWGWYRTMTVIRWSGP